MQELSSVSMDDVWLDRARLDSTALVKARRRYRVKMVLAVGVSYALDAFFLALFWRLGVVLGEVPVLYLLAGLGHVGIFMPLHWVGLSERAQNAHLVQWQVAYAMVVQLVAIYWAPGIKSYFFGISFVIFAFAALRMTIRELLVAWLLFCLSLCGVLWALSGSPSPSLPASSGTFLVAALAFASVLLRCIVLNHYGTVLRMRMVRTTSRLEQDLKKAESIAVHDKLTGALNRHVVPVSLDELIQLRRRKDIHAAVAMLDLDHFKTINDVYGHLTGDAVLVRLVGLVEHTLRPMDKLIRYGGEEFLLLMPSSTIQEGLVAVERLRKQLADVDWEEIAPGLRVTVSIGLTDVSGDDVLEAVIERADQCLYQAKRAGRNRTVWQASACAGPVHDADVGR